MNIMPVALTQSRIWDTADIKLVFFSLSDLLMNEREHTENHNGRAMPMGRLGLGRDHRTKANADFQEWVRDIIFRYTVKPHRRRIQCVIP